MKLTQAFYNRDTCQVAQELLGKYFVRMENGVPLVVRICETEAYIGRIDKACHAYQYRRTPRTETLFAPPGTAYLYLIYGIYHCLNFVTEPEGEPCAVLIRGGQARGNVARLTQNRYGKAPDELTTYQKKQFLNGPGKLCKALSLTRMQNGLSLLGEDLFVCDRLEASVCQRPQKISCPSTFKPAPASALSTQKRQRSFPGGIPFCRAMSAKQADIGTPYGIRIMVPASRYAAPGHPVLPGRG